MEVPLLVHNLTAEREEDEAGRVGPNARKDEVLVVVREQAKGVDGVVREGSAPGDLSNTEPQGDLTPVPLSGEVLVGVVLVPDHHFSAPLGETPSRHFCCSTRGGAPGAAPRG